MYKLCYSALNLLADKNIFYNYMIRNVKFCK